MWGLSIQYSFCNMCWTLLWIWTQFWFTSYATILPHG